MVRMYCAFLPSLPNIWFIISLIFGIKLYLLIIYQCVIRLFLNQNQIEGNKAKFHFKEKLVFILSKLSMCWIKKHIFNFQESWCSMLVCLFEEKNEYLLKYKIWRSEVSILSFHHICDCEPFSYSINLIGKYQKLVYHDSLSLFYI